MATQDTLRRKQPNKRSDVKNTNTETWRTQQTLKGGGPKHAKIVCVRGGGRDDNKRCDVVNSTTAEVRLVSWFD